MIYTRETLHKAFTKDIWQKLLPAVEACAVHALSTSPHIDIIQYSQKNIPKKGIAHHKHCVLLYSSKSYEISTAQNTVPRAVREPYSQENDTIYYDYIDVDTVHVPENSYYCIIPKTAYTIHPPMEAYEITALYIPYYLLMEGNATIDVQCFSMLHAFVPENAHEYPVLTTWTLEDVIDSLGIETEVVRIVFVDAVATRKEMPVIPNTKVTLFPGIGGG